VKIPKKVKCAIRDKPCEVDANGWGSCGDAICEPQTPTVYCCWIDDTEKDILEWQEIPSGEFLK